ncbi:MAG: hypothetical protein WDZ94_05525 [Patescibacteria group bacterium]
MFNYEIFNSNVEKLQESGSKLLVVSGPTAVGKDTVIKSLPLEGPKRGLNFRAIRNYSTKKPRLEEADNPDYDYLDTVLFREKIAQEALIEYIEYTQGTNTTVLVGTSIEQMIPQRNNEHIVWKVSPNRLLEITSLLSSDGMLPSHIIVPIFLGVSHLSTLYERAKERAGSKEEWLTRLRPNFKQRIADEYAFWKINKNTLRPYVVHNNTHVSDTCAQIITVALNKTGIKV